MNCAASTGFAEQAPASYRSNSFSVFSKGFSEGVGSTRTLPLAIPPIAIPASANLVLLDGPLYYFGKSTKGIRVGFSKG